MHPIRPSADGDLNGRKGDSLHRWWDSLRQPLSSTASMDDFHSLTKGENSPSRKLRSKLGLRGSWRQPRKDNNGPDQVNASSTQYLYAPARKLSPEDSTSEEDTCSTIVYDRRNCCGCRKKPPKEFHLSEEITLLLRHR